jgi:hypothetical protein
MTDAVCRFCLEEETTKANPFLTPCACIGTNRYVHRACLTKWRNSTTVETHKIKCQLCLTYYILPRRWPLESIPNNDFLWETILSQYTVLITLKHYLHLILLLYFYPMMRYIATPFSFNFILKTSLSLFSYYAFLLFFTSIYFLYYFILYKKVRNKQHYIIIASPKICLYIVALTVCASLVNLCIFPFGGLYIYTLISYRGVHIRTLERLNTEGAL